MITFGLKECFIIITCRYEFRLRIALGPTGDLMLTSRIRNTNTDGKSFAFTFAYHTYLYVTDIRFFVVAFNSKLYLLSNVVVAHT